MITLLLPPRLHMLQVAIAQSDARGWKIVDPADMARPVAGLIRVADLLMALRATT